MAYRLKKVQYKNKACHILLQNENGPCPLLAAGNCLLLKGTITLPSNCIGAGVVTIDELVNVLAEKILSNQSGSAQTDHLVQEVLTIFPSLQFGMDVNPKFTAGPTGVEYTMHLNAFDLLHIELVHGWLLDPNAQEYDLINNQTYNQLVNMVIEGNDAVSILESDNNNGQHRNYDDLTSKATTGSIVKSFLDGSAHQLTQYGLTVLHEYLTDGQMVVFFRNNHFNTLTKHEGLLYLLVTDFGYANVSSVVWEKLDVIDGDTEYVTDQFKPPNCVQQNMGAAAATPEQLVANNMQSQADYQLALQLSQENPQPGAASNQPTANSQDPELEAARQASLEEYRQSHPDYAGPFDTSAEQSSAPMPPPVADRADSNGPSMSNQGNQAQTQSTQTAHPTLVALPEVSSAADSASAPGGAPRSQEEQDLMLAMQLQKQEEDDRARRLNDANDGQSLRLAREMQQREHTLNQQRVSRPGAPPGRIPTAPPSARVGGQRGRPGKDSICIIS